MATKTMRRGSKGTPSRPPVSVRFEGTDAEMCRLLEARAEASDRSLSNQIKHYVRLALIAEDNPDLPLALVLGIREAQAELRAGLAQPYQWGVLEPERG